MIYHLDLTNSFMVSIIERGSGMTNLNPFTRSDLRLDQLEPADDTTTILTLYLPPISTHELGVFFLWNAVPFEHTPSLRNKKF